MWRLVVISVMGVSLSSCGTLPKGHAGPAVPVARILEAVRCQVADAFAPGNPDPAGMVEWKMLATVTIDGGRGYETRPGVAGVAGKSGKASWTAPGGGLTFKDDTTLYTRAEIRTRDIPALIAIAPCANSDAAHGLGVETWLREAKAGQPGPSSGATAGKTTYKRVYKVEASAGGGLKFTFADYSVSFEGNKASASNTYTVDVRFGPQSGEDSPFLGAGPQNLGLNASGQFDDYSDLRADRDRDEEKDTIIKVPPGQSIIIGP